MRRARIWGTGSSVPDRVVTNADLCKLIDTSDEWIVERTGIRERRWIPEGSGLGSAELGTQAARKAIADAGIAPEQIGLVVFATLSPDHDFPGNGVLLQKALRLPAPATLDIRQQCNGFIYGVSIADAYIRAGLHDYVLVVAAEVQSTGLDISDHGRDMTVIFADGAGAAVLGPSEDEQSRILSTHLHVDGGHAADLWCEFPSSRQSPRMSPEVLAQGRHFPRMNGRIVFKHAVSRMQEAVQEAMAANGVTLDDIDLLVPHQANLRIIENVREALGLPVEKVAVNIDRYGNTTGASIPLALDEARLQGRVKTGDLVCLVAFGSGFTWGSALLRL
jgi:3-oxoacyl-[acyl-carrier-protein] synthase III